METSETAIPSKMRRKDPTKEVKYRFNFQTRQVEADNLESTETVEERLAREKQIAEVQDRIGTQLIWLF